MLQVAFTTIANTFEPAITSGEPFPLINGIAAVHVAYNTMEKEIFWLAELSDGFPELPSTLQETDILSSEKVVCFIRTMYVEYNKYYIFLSHRFST